MTRILIVEDNEELIFIITKPIVDTLLDLAKKYDGEIQKSKIQHIVQV